MRFFRFLLETICPYKKQVFGIILSMTLCVIHTNVSPYLVKIVIDMISKNQYQSLWWVMGLFIFSQTLIIIAWALYDYFGVRLYPKMKSDIIQKLIGKMDHFQYLFFQDHLSGRISSKLSDVTNFSVTMVDVVLNKFYQYGLMLIMSLILLSNINPFLGLAFFFWICLYGIIGCANIKHAVQISRKESESSSQLWGNLVDYLSNMFTVTIFSLHKYEKKRLNQYLQGLETASEDKYYFYIRYFVIQGIIFSTYFIGSLCWMIHLCKQGRITPGDFALMFMLTWEVISNLGRLTIVIRDWINNAGSIEEALAFFDAAPIMHESKQVIKLHVNKGTIDFKEVSFGYPGMPLLFKGLSVSIKAGEKVGLVGYSGGGKSTFISLILRLYDLQKGEIYINQQAISEVDLSGLREQIGMIPQDSSLFHRSLRENILYGQFDATDQEIFEASRCAAAEQFILTLPKGYDSLVGERGVKLSGGQRQRIAIARAFLKQAPILLLDEATSALDSSTEREIQQSLYALMENKTTIVIAHRLSTLLQMDRLLVFDRGKIVQNGSHEELLKSDGLYKKLWDAQANGFLPEY